MRELKMDRKQVATEMRKEVLRKPELWSAGSQHQWEPANNLKTTVLAQIQLRVLQGAGVDCSGLCIGIWGCCVSHCSENMWCALLQALTGSNETVRRNERQSGRIQK